MKATQKHKHRDHWELIRVTLRFMYNSDRPLSALRILYNLQGASSEVHSLLKEMEYLGLVKVSTRDFENSYTRRLEYSVTQKGAKILELLDGQAQMLSKSPWIDENILHVNK